MWLLILKYLLFRVYNEWNSRGYAQQKLIGAIKHLYISHSVVLIDCQLKEHNFTIYVYRRVRKARTMSNLYGPSKLGFIIRITMAITKHN
jgi:hypothetical protein